MNYKYTISTAIIGLSIAFSQPQVAKAICSNSQVDATAEKITVLIDSQEPGSGVIIKKEGNTYTVLTAYHVVKNQNFKYTIVTPDKQRYPLNYQTVKQLSNKIDLAVLQFTSDKDYQVAKLGNSDTLTRRTNVYVAGFPKATAAVKLSIYDCRGGQVIANATQVTADNGYNLIYDNATLFGMSGGAVLNDQEEVIGIHGRGEESSDVDIDKINSSVATVKSGRNSGIPIKIFMELSKGLPEIPKPIKPKVDDFLVQAADKYGKGDYRGAILAYDEVIRLNPNNSEALLYRGATYIALGDKQGAIQDFNQALKINPNDAKAYNNRGATRSDLGDKQGAIADFNQALNFNPNDALAYYNRGLARSNLGDKQAAIQDYNQAIKINPNDAQAYNNRGATRSALGDKQAAIQDYNQAIKINPNYALAYNNRGNARSALGDKQGAITDFNQAININPKLAEPYYNRGNARLALGDKQGAISDLQQAANLFQQQGNLGAYQMTLENITKIQQQ